MTQRVKIVLRSVVRRPSNDHIMEWTEQFVQRGYSFELPDNEMIEGADYYVGSSNVPPRDIPQAELPFGPSAPPKPTEKERIAAYYGCGPTCSYDHTPPPLNYTPPTHYPPTH